MLSSANKFYQLTRRLVRIAAQGDGFMAIGMGFQNTAGAEKHQAVALLVQSDKAIFLNCKKCEFQAEAALRDAGRLAIRNYLGWPWRECSRTIFMESETPDFIDKAGYLPWNGDFGLKTLWYAEFGNTGPGASTAGRVNWPGFKKVISKADATKFTVENFLHAQPWIDPTGTPVKYDLFT